MFEREWLVTDHFRRMCREIYPSDYPLTGLFRRVRRFVHRTPVPPPVAQLVSPTLAQTRFLMAVCLGQAGLPDEARVCERFAAGTETAGDYLFHALDCDDQEVALWIDVEESLSYRLFHEGPRLFPERSAAGCDAVRDIFGNPFRPVAFDPGWRTETAVGIARRIADSREYGNLPVLADALQDAGCDAAAVLDHCRDPGDHVPGCWVVEAVLRGNEPRQFILPRPPGSG